MGSVALVFRAWLRQRLRPVTGLALLTGLISGVALTAVAGARRTDTAYPRLLRWSNAADVQVIPNCVGLGGFYQALGRLPQVALFASWLGVSGTAVIPVRLVLLAILIAAGPGRAAARISPATVLRAE